MNATSESPPAQPFDFQEVMCSVAVHDETPFVSLAPSFVRHKTKIPQKFVIKFLISKALETI